MIQTYRPYLPSKFFILTFLLSLNTIGSLISAQSVFFEGGNICPTQPWKLVFEDNFDSTALDPNIWITYFPDSPVGDDQCEFCRTHGNEGQVYLDSNVKMENGILKLIAKKQLSTWYNSTRNYSSGMIHSRPSFKYGKFEARCKIPFGMGFWPAYWFFGYPGTEIDMFEFGTQNPEHLHYGIRKWRDQKVKAQKGGNDDSIDLSKDFHLYTVEWEPYYISYKLDEREIGRFRRYFTIDGEAIDYCCLDQGAYIEEPAFPTGEPNKLNIIFNLAVGIEGGPFTDAPNAETKIPNSFDIDYVKVYQRDSVSSPKNSTI